MKNNLKFTCFIFWFLSCTWGIIMTLIGGISVLMTMLICKIRPKKFGFGIQIAIPGNFGGLDLGPFAIINERPSYSLRCHELGHSFQNIILGPLFPFVVAIPSATRYWLREFASQRGKYIYSFILVGAFVLLGILITFLSFLSTGFSIIFAIIGTIIVAYGIGLGIWIIFFEIPKYKNGKYVNYDDMYWEGLASSQGTNFMRKNFPEQK